MPASCNSVSQARNAEAASTSVNTDAEEIEDKHLLIPDSGEGRRVEAWWGGRFWRAKTLRRHVDGSSGDEYYLVRWGDDTWMATVRLV